MIRLSGYLVLLGSALLLLPVQAFADPCNFDDGSQAFSWERVMRCYESVPFNDDDLENVVSFILAARERSDLREIFDARIGWRESTAALDDPETKEDYASDFAMQMAIVSNHKEFLNPHWRYTRSLCYTAFLGAFIPFDFGSDLETRGRNGSEQIFFIEDAPFLPALYEEATGIRASDYIGLKIISINDFPPGEYFREWGRTVYRFDENDGVHLNGVLANATYSLRVSLNHDIPPDRPFDTFVLEAKNGHRVSIEMPWVFAPRSAFGLEQFPLELSQSTSQFAELCDSESATFSIFGRSNVLSKARRWKLPWSPRSRWLSTTIRLGSFRIRPACC